MQDNVIAQGVRPGGLVSSTEIRILLCYLLHNIKTPISRQQIEGVLLGKAFVNYFALAESLAQLCEHKLAAETADGFVITSDGETVAQTLADSLPRTIKEDAVKGVILAQQYAAKAAANHCTIQKSEQGNIVDCSIKDEGGSLFGMQIFMPDELTAESVKQAFVENADLVYKLVLSALTKNKELAQDALAGFEEE